ncbi:MAG TPA: GNAT family N-acetyltransferase [Abditibacteriaceae bacterium]|nr:GNAT family N-acetyltransferase [Abditibacteriaceae bacterium]
MTIETVTTVHFERVLPLIAGYQRFYGAEPDENRNRAHFSQFLDDHSRGVLFAALDSDTVLGFATLYFPFSSVRARSVCLMNDLFTTEGARGKGVGRALVRHCHSYARSHDFPTLMWNTEQNNHAAQRLYDRLGATRSAWLEYVLPA